MQALVDRPDEVRRMVNFKRMALTDFKIDIPRLAKKKVLTAALEESGMPLVCLLHIDYVCHLGRSLVAAQHHACWPPGQQVSIGQ